MYRERTRYVSISFARVLIIHIQLLHFQNHLQLHRRSQRQARDAEDQARRHFVCAENIAQQFRRAVRQALGCSVNSGVAAMYTPSLTMRRTRLSEPSCFFARAIALSAAMDAALRPSSMSRFLPAIPVIATARPDVASIPVRKSRLPGPHVPHRRRNGFSAAKARSSGWPLSHFLSRWLSLRRC